MDWLAVEASLQAEMEPLDVVGAFRVMIRCAPMRAPHLPGHLQLR